jgi:hypothetical protein
VSLASGKIAAVTENSAAQGRANLRSRAAEAIRQSGQLAEQQARRAEAEGAVERAERERAHAARAREIVARLSGPSGPAELLACVALCATLRVLGTGI